MIVIISFCYCKLFDDENINITMTMDVLLIGSSSNFYDDASVVCSSTLL